MSGKNSQEDYASPRMRNSGNKVILGVDVGGTKVAAGLVNSAGEIVMESRTRMVARENANRGLRAVFDAIDSVMRDPRAKNAGGIGVCVPGWVDFHRGSVIKAANLPCWRNFPLARKIASHYNLPTQIANDADAAALAEAKWGAGAKTRSVFYVSLGTGIGTGMVIDHQIQLGHGGSAFEGGHMTINFDGPVCPCGKRGCIEMYSSGTAIARIARERLSGILSGSGARRTSRSKMVALAGGTIEAITSETVSKAAAAGDTLATHVLEEAADHLAIWLGNIIDLLEPGIIVVGGGTGRLMMGYMQRMRRQLDCWSINPRQKKVAIVAARYGAESALVGAAALCILETSR
jgi:glucokinase